MFNILTTNLLSEEIKNYGRKDLSKFLLNSTYCSVPFLVCLQCEYFINLTLPGVLMLHFYLGLMMNNEVRFSI